MNLNVKRFVTVILLVTMLALIAAFCTSCGVVGADIRLEGLNLGTVSMEGKPLAGLPSDKINLDLDVSAQTVKVHTSGNSTIITMIPSGAVVEITGNTVSFKGLKSNQVKVEWAVNSSQ
jgi:hypothetical protein